MQLLQAAINAISRSDDTEVRMHIGTDSATLIIDDTAPVTITRTGAGYGSNLTTGTHTLADFATLIYYRARFAADQINAVRASVEKNNAEPYAIPIECAPEHMGLAFNWLGVEAVAFPEHGAATTTWHLKPKGWSPLAVSTENLVLELMRYCTDIVNKRIAHAAYAFSVPYSTLNTDILITNEAIFRPADTRLEVFACTQVELYEILSAFGLEAIEFRTGDKIPDLKGNEVLVHVL